MCALLDLEDIDDEILAGIRFSSDFDATTSMISFNFAQFSKVHRFLKHMPGQVRMRGVVARICLETYPRSSKVEDVRRWKMEAAEVVGKGVVQMSLRPTSPRGPHRVFHHPPRDRAVLDTKGLLTAALKCHH